tara:strand:+ start:1455 stop:2297 length:843 start_codon:yes stop_codon:yes gene_type:complete
MNTEQKQTEHQMLMEFIEQDCSVDITKKIPYPPVALSYGEKVIRTSKEDILVPIALGTFGNLSVITAPPKTMKTFFVSLLASAFLSGTNIYGGQIKGHRKDGHLIHFDTEQGQWHAAKVFRRPLDMDSNIPQDKYHTFALRTVAFKERLEFIEYYLSEKIDEPSLVIIDGIADLLADVNNIEQSNKLVSELMRISTQYNVHIINVIHQNYGSQKLGTGHLGSALEKKAETVISLEANTVNKEWVTVRCGRSRGYCFETFSFKVNEKGLPTIVDDLYDPLK